MKTFDGQLFQVHCKLIRFFQTSIYLNQFRSELHFSNENISVLVITYYIYPKNNKIC